MTESTIPDSAAATPGPRKNAAGWSAAPTALDALAEAQSLLGQRRTEDAENVIRSALKADNDPLLTSRLYSMLGQVWAAQRRTHDAREAFQHAVLLAPMSPDAHGYLGYFLLRNGDLQDAETEIRRAISLDPKASFHHSNLGELLFTQCFFKDAHVSLRRAVRLNPRNLRAREVLAKLLAEQRDYRGAEKALEEARVIDPRSISVLWTLADIFETQGKIDQAVACKKRLLALDPNNAQLHIRIGDQLRKAGRFDAAEQAVRGALALQPSPDAYHCLSQILDAQSRTTEAISAMKDALKLNPDSKIYRDHLGKLATGRVGPDGVGIPPRDTARPSEPTRFATPLHGAFAKIRAFWRRPNTR